MEYGSSHQSIIVRAGSRTKKERLLVQRFAEEFDGLFEAGSLIFFLWFSFLFVYQHLLCSLPFSKWS